VKNHKIKNVLIFLILQMHFFFYLNSVGNNKYLDILHSQWSRQVTESQYGGVVLDDTYCHTIHNSNVQIVYKYFYLYPFFFLLLKMF
jgi:hypothetical protein